MSWPCFLIKSIRTGDWEPDGDGRIKHTFYTLPDGREVKFDDLPPGAMWHSDLFPPDYHWMRVEGPTVCVVLPGKVIWRMNHKGSDGCLWNVSGEMPNITATPSINFVGTYHGWVTNGVVTDDCDGRKFDSMGKLESAVA